jgi:hypothetical protein
MCRLAKGYLGLQKGSINADLYFKTERKSKKGGSTDIGDAERPVNYANFFLNDVRTERREVLIFDPVFTGFGN